MLTLGKKDLIPGIEWIEKYIPVPKDHEVLVKVLYTAICGTDVHIYEMNEWAQNRVKQPHTMGHEFVGRIVGLGKDAHVRKVGDLISAETHEVCHSCEFCLNNQMHICENTIVLGVDVDGCFAQYICIPEENAVLNDENIPLTQLAIQEPLGNAVHTLMAQDIKNKTVVISGAGPIGIMAVDVAKAMGAKSVIAIDVVDYRLNLAKHIGADDVINPLHDNVIEKVRELLGKNGADVVCEMSGNAKALKQALSYVKPGGHLSILGIPNEEIQIDVSSEIVFKGIHIHGITGREMFRTWDKVKELLLNQQLHLDKVITHILDWKEIELGMKLMMDGKCGKVLLMVNEDE